MGISSIQWSMEQLNITNPMLESDRPKTTRQPNEPVTRVSTARLDFDMTDQNIDEAERMKRIQDLFKETVPIQESDLQKAQQMIKILDERNAIKGHGSDMTDHTFYSAQKELQSVTEVESDPPT